MEEDEEEESGFSSHILCFCKKKPERVQGQDIRGNNDRKKEGTERDEETGSGNEMKSRTNEREKSRGRNSEGYRKRWGAAGVSGGGGMVD